MSAITRKSCYIILLLVIFTVLFFIVRIPLLHEPLGFEEGIFADLIVNRPPGPLYELAGRIDGENIYSYISHPAIPYELLRLGGYISQHFLTRDVYLNDAAVTPRLRIICSSYQFIFGIVLLLFAFYGRSVYGIWPTVLIFAAMLSPLAIKTSVHLQIDNTSGVILCGIAALLFIIADRGEPASKKAYLLLFTGGFIAGLGKQEWSFSLLAAVIAVVLWDMFRKSNTDRKSDCRIIIPLSITAGLVIGNCASYLYDPVNYARGFHILYRHVNIFENTSPGWEFSSWLTLTKHRLPFASICFVLLFVIILSFFTNTRRSLLRRLLLLYGSFLLMGFILSDWHSQPRYYCPSLAVLTVSAIVMIPPLLPRWYHRTLFCVTVLVFLSTVVFLIGFVPNPNPELEQINSGVLRSSPDTVLYIQSGAGWNKPDIDYMNNNSPFANVKQKVADKFGKELVSPRTE